MQRGSGTGPKGRGMVAIETLTEFSSVTDGAGPVVGGGAYLLRPMLSMRGRMEGGCADGVEETVEKDREVGGGARANTNEVI